jgi:hypothetical protein
MNRARRMMAMGMFDSGSVFSPADISGLELWLKADAITGLADGAAVASWLDSSGNARHAVQATGALKPLYKVNIINGLPVVRFNSDILSTPTIDLTGTNAVTLFAVFTAAAGSDDIVVEFSDNYNSVTDGFILYRATAGDAVVAAAIGNIASSQWTTAAGVTTTPACVSAVYNKSLPITQEVRAWVNGVLGGSEVFYAENTNNFGNRALHLGSRLGGSAPLDGDLAEIILYSSALSDANRQAVEAYLIAKYALNP